MYSNFFEKVFEAYHGTVKHPHEAEMDASLLKCEPFTEAESAMIISTRIRVGRNLEGKPFGAGIQNP
jgi:hypothetical protein